MIKKYLYAPMAVAAAALAAIAPSVHAQVTFDDTAANAGLTAVATGTQAYFWDNAPGTFLIVITVGIVLGFIALIARAFMRKRRMS